MFVPESRLVRRRRDPVDILPGLKSGASTSLTSLRPLGIEPNGRRSRCIPPLEKEGFSERAPLIMESFGSRTVSLMPLRSITKSGLYRHYDDQPGLFEIRLSKSAQKTPASLGRW